MEKWENKKILVYMLLYDDDIIGGKVQNNSKLIWQIRSFEKMGLDVWYFLYAKSGVYICNKDIRIRIMNSVGGFRGFVHRNRMNRAFIKAFKKINGFDYAYIRNMVSLPSYVRVLKKLHKAGTKIVVEIPTYSKAQVSEDVNSSRRFRVAVMPLLEIIKKKTYKYIDLYALIGEHDSSYNGIPAVNINNGINALEISDFPKRDYCRKEHEYHMLALGHMRAYHGVERIIEGMDNYINNGGTEKVYLHIVGSDADGSLAKNMELANSYNLNDFVINEGICYGDKLNEICNKCDIAFSALAYYKKNGVVGNELKTREYMSRGIPFVISVRDEILPENAEYIMSVGNDEQPIDIKTVVDFVDSISSNDDVKHDMQSYSFEKMTWIPELKKVLDKLAE